MFSLIRLQEYLHFKAHQHLEAISSPPFTLFLHPADSSSEANYALPNLPESNNELQGAASGGLVAHAKCAIIEQYELACIEE
jgi:hypothetical protein